MTACCISVHCIFIFTFTIIILTYKSDLPSPSDGELASSSYVGGEYGVANFNLREGAICQGKSWFARKVDKSALEHSRVCRGGGWCWGWYKKCRKFLRQDMVAKHEYNKVED